MQGKSSKILKPKWQKSKKAVLRLAWITISPMTYHAFLTLHTVSAEDTARSIHTGIYCGVYIFTRFPFHLNSGYRRTSSLVGTFFLWKCWASP